MSAPLSLGQLDGCLVDCPLHSGQFDLSTGLATPDAHDGGLDAEGEYHPVWSPPGKEPKPDLPGIKAEARRFTRVRRIRYYPVRIRDGMLEVAIPEAWPPPPRVAPPWPPRTRGDLVPGSKVSNSPGST